MTQHCANPAVVLFFVVVVLPLGSWVLRRLLPEEPRSRRLMTSDQDAKVVAEPQVQQVQEAKDNVHLVRAPLG